MADLTLSLAFPSRGLTVLWMLEELGEPYEIDVLDLSKGDHKAPEFLKKNPMGRVPVLRHGERFIWESVAICTYLADAFPDAGLGVPVSDPARGEYLQWIFFGPGTMEPAIIWKTTGDLDAEYQPFASVLDVASTLALALKDREYLVGDRFTTADVIVGAGVMWGTRMMPALPALPELESYWQRLEARPGWQRTSEIFQSHLNG
ncbi:MAG: glutathione S-transferase family protein [Pseudomonadales bacterium]|nr:glutathione S-transferase family protein [Pseudomonadales bacterium]